MTVARFCYGLMQLTTLTELDLSGNPIPAEMQINLQVKMHALLRLLKYIIISTL